MRIRITAVLLACVACLSAASFRPDEVKIVGDIDYGQAGTPVDCSDTPRYRALVFNGNSGDRIEVTVKGGDRKAFVAFADGTLTELATGTNRLAFTLPSAGPDAQAYYIVLRDTEDKPARFTVELKKVKKPMAA